MHGNIEDFKCPGKVINVFDGAGRITLTAVIFIIDRFVFFNRKRLHSLDRILSKKDLNVFSKEA